MIKTRTLEVKDIKNEEMPMAITIIKIVAIFYLLIVLSSVNLLNSWLVIYLS